MGRGHECVAGGEHFPTKKALKERCKEILDTHDCGEALTGADLKVMMDVLDHHPNSDEKKGSGVAAIYVDVAPEYRMPSGMRHRNIGDKGFWIERTFADEDDVHFSYQKCINTVDWSDTLPGDDNSEESEDASDEEATIDDLSEDEDNQGQTNPDKELADSSGDGGGAHM